MRTYQRAGAFSVHVQVSDVKFLFRALYFLRVLRIDRASQPKFAVVGHR